MCRGIVGQTIGDCGQSCSLLPVYSTSKCPSLLSHLGVFDVGLIAAVLKNELLKNQKTGFLTPALPSSSYSEWVRDIYHDESPLIIKKVGIAISVSQIFPESKENKYRKAKEINIGKKYFENP